MKKAGLDTKPGPAFQANLGPHWVESEEDSAERGARIECQSGQCSRDDCFSPLRPFEVVIDLTGRAGVTLDVSPARSTIKTSGFSAE